MTLKTITVAKLDHAGHETLRYNGQVLDRGATWIQIEATFSRDDVTLDYVTFRKGDRMVEWFYSDRWYNVFELYDVTHRHLKGWYCNITRPAILREDYIGWPDLALDLWVSPAGDVWVMDEDEFAALPLDDVTRAAALAALDDLRGRAERGESPFVPTIG